MVFCGIREVERELVILVQPSPLLSRCRQSKPPVRGEAYPELHSLSSSEGLPFESSMLRLQMGDGIH